jgi:hypothetical protein
MEPSFSRIPDVFVLWHPACALGEGLARQIHGWLRPGGGLGPEVFYRCISAPDTEPGALPLPLPGEPRGAAPAGGAMHGSSTHVNEQILILLIDDHMVADAAWRYWLGELADTRATVPLPRTFVPVALDSTAYNVPNPIRELNFLRPAGLPIEEGASDETRAAALAKVTRSLLKQLTETLCRHLLGTLPPGNPAGLAQPATGAAAESMAPKISLFLSHAKVDGATPARRIRDYIYSQTQLAAFYDENDIPFGSAFSRVLDASIQSSQTAALIAVRSARYASRPWCRRELSLFRRPRQESINGQLPERWRLQPMLVVDALEPGARTVGIPETGNATLIRWSDDAPELEEQIVTTVLRDALLAAFHASLGRSLAPVPDSVILNWLPDPTTLLHVPAVRDAAREVTVVHPGRGLSGLELDTLAEYFPQVVFRSFDQAKR